MFYRCDDVPVWQAWCQYHQELKVMQQAARAFAESLDAEPVYGASVYGQILVGIAPAILMTGVIKRYGVSLAMVGSGCPGSMYPRAS